MIRTEARLMMSGNEDGYRLDVTDVPSGVTLAKLHLSDAEVLALLRGTSLKVSSLMGEDVAARVGKLMEVEGVIYSRSDVQRLSTYADRQLASAEADARVSHPGWETYSGSRTNFGIRVTLRRWLDPTP